MGVKQFLTFYIFRVQKSKEKPTKEAKPSCGLRASDSEDQVQYLLILSLLRLPSPKLINVPKLQTG